MSVTERGKAGVALAYASAAALGLGTLHGGAVAADTPSTDDARSSQDLGPRAPRPRPSLTPNPFPTPTPQATIIVYPALLKVTARNAAETIPRSAKVTLVAKVTTGPGQEARIRGIVRPTRARADMTVTTTAKGKVVLRTDKAPKARVTVRITATGPENTPTTWTRTWKVR